jgi:hypothetical protein
LFTRSLQDKTKLLDKLQQQATIDDYGFQSEIIQDLTRHAILTEDDWQYFRSRFKKYIRVSLCGSTKPLPT